MRKLGLLAVVVLVMTFVVLPMPGDVVSFGGPVSIRGDDLTTYSDLTAAIAEAVNGDVLEVSNGFSNGPITIDKDLTIVGVGGSHTITMTGRITVSGGGRLTLGDGSTDNTLKLQRENYIVVVSNGVVVINDGIEIDASGSTYYPVQITGSNAKGIIRGGVMKGYYALDVQNGALVSEISGGHFIGALYGINLDGSEITKISGGSIEGGTSGIYCTAKATIDEITGGDFQGNRGMHNNRTETIIGEISGGTFIGTSRGIYNDDGARIDRISNGEFKGQYGMYNTSGAEIGEISGGIFQGTEHGIYNQTDVTIDKISGGEFTGKDGMRNTGSVTIDEISGGVFTGYKIPVAPDTEGGTGIYNQPGVVIDKITGGEFTSNWIGLYTSGVGARINEISLGTFHGDTYALCVNNDAVVKKISGGTYTAEGNAIYIGDDTVVEEISGGTLSARLSGLYIRPTGRVDEISGGSIDGFGNGGISNQGTIALISDGTFIGSGPNGDGLYNDGARAVITTISGGSFQGSYSGIHNIGSGQISTIRDVTCVGRNGIVNNATIDEIINVSAKGSGTGLENLKNGQIGEVSGDIAGESRYGIHNQGVIDQISGGIITGWWFALYNDASQAPGPGQINNITGGVFWGQSTYGAIRLVSTVNIEPGIAAGAEIGECRFWGYQGQVFNQDARAILPPGYRICIETLPVAGITEVEFRYLSADHHDVTFNANGGSWIGGLTAVTRGIVLGGTVGAMNMPPEPSRSRHVFEGWVDAGGNAFEATTVVNSDLIVYAKWRSTGGSGGDPNPDPAQDSRALRVNLEAAKRVSGEGSRLGDGQFSFAVYEGDTEVATGRNDRDGRVVFSAITYTRAGNHTYRIVETSADSTDWSTDKGAYAVTVRVTNNNGTLAAEISYQDGTVPTFHNEYTGAQETVDSTAALKVTKRLLGDRGMGTGFGLEFLVVLFEQTGAGEWSEVGEYTVTAYGPGVVIPGLQGGKTYQLVERTSGWFRALNIGIKDDSGGISRINGSAIAISVPNLTQNITVDLEVTNQRTGEPGGFPDAAVPLKDPPLFEILDLAPPLASFTSEHIAYIVGYPNGNVEPELNITRAEAATMLFRLLSEETRGEFWAEENPFPDVGRDMWHNNAISVMYNLDYLKGFPDGSFKPDKAITRGEFATVIGQYVRSMGVMSADDLSFADTVGHWAEDDINYAAAAGLVDGFPDGTFRPDQSITRAQTVALMNRMLERAPETVEDLLVDEMILWTDNADPAQWYYLAIQEATNSHLHAYKGSFAPGSQIAYEFWTEMTQNPDWVRMERVWLMMYGGKAQITNHKSQITSHK